MYAATFALSLCRYSSSYSCDADLRGKFSAIHREYSPQPRKFYVFCTSVTDPTTTSGIIASGSFHRVLVLVLRLTSCQFGTWLFGNTSNNRGSSDLVTPPGLTAHFYTSTTFSDGLLSNAACHRIPLTTSQLHLTR